MPGMLAQVIPPVRGLIGLQTPEEHCEPEVQSAPLGRLVVGGCGGGNTGGCGLTTGGCGLTTGGWGLTTGGGGATVTVGGAVGGGVGAVQNCCAGPGPRVACHGH